MEPAIGFQPMTSPLREGRSQQLSYAGTILEPKKGLEPLTFPLPKGRSSTELQRLGTGPRTRTGTPLRTPKFEPGASDHFRQPRTCNGPQGGTRTHTPKRQPLKLLRLPNFATRGWYGKRDSNPHATRTLTPEVSASIQFRHSRTRYSVDLLIQRSAKIRCTVKMVGPRGFEPLANRPFGSETAPGLQSGEGKRTQNEKSASGPEAADALANWRRGWDLNPRDTATNRTCAFRERRNKPDSATSPLAGATRQGRPSRRMRYAVGNSYAKASCRLGSRRCG